MNNSTQQALLTYLEEQKEQTQSSLTSQNHTNWYWKSGNHFKDSELQLTNSQVDFFITNGEKRSEELKDRLEWLELQIKNVKFSERLERIKNNLTEEQQLPIGMKQASSKEALNHLFNKNNKNK